MGGGLIPKKGLFDLFSKELRFSSKTDDYFSMHKVMKFFEKIAGIFEKFKEKIKVIELNESPLVENEEFEINLSSFILLFKGSYEYLVFIQLKPFADFTKEDFKRYLDVFTLSSKRKGFFIIWNESDLKSVLITRREFYSSLESIFDKLSSLTKPLEDLLEHMTKDKVEKKIEVKHHKFEEVLNISSDFQNKLIHNFRYESKIDRMVLESKEGLILKEKTLKRIQGLFDEFLNSEINVNQLREEFLKIYKFKKDS